MVGNRANGPDSLGNRKFAVIRVNRATVSFGLCGSRKGSGTKRETHAWFVATRRAANPEVVVAVLVAGNGKHGGRKRAGGPVSMTRTSLLYVQDKEAERPRVKTAREHRAMHTGRLARCRR